jgi:hypothetical protein
MQQHVSKSIVSYQEKGYLLNGPGTTDGMIFYRKLGFVFVLATQCVQASTTFLCVQQTLLLLLAVLMFDPQ